MIVICTITVVSMHFMSKADVEGKVLNSNQFKYLVDFSEDAKMRGFDGDYSKKLVDKKDCLEK